MEEIIVNCSLSSSIKENIVAQLHKKRSNINVDSLLKTGSKQSNNSQIIRLECDIDSIDPLSWLSHQSYSEKLYWTNRNNEFEVAGVGIADSIIGNAKVNYKEIIAYIQSHLCTDYPNLRYYGGISFSDSQNPTDCWKPLGSYRFILPRFEILKSREGKLSFCCNLKVQSATDLSHQLEKLESSIKDLKFTPQLISGPPPRWLSKETNPVFSNWESVIKEILAMINGGSLEKIVLARKTLLRFESHINPYSLIKRIKQYATNCYHYCFQANNELAFIGASPERLYKRKGRTIFVEAVAGTRSRGNAEKNDAFLGQELMNSEKDRREHQFVVENIKQALARLGCSIEGNGSLSLLKLHKIQHLALGIQGVLPENISDTDILTALHPTSAVGGWPTDKALEYIHSNEGFCRGWYAGPVGWLDGNGSEFAVAIRSGLIHGNQMDVYTGAGIIRGSNPEEEWQEMNNKFDSFIGKALA